MDFTSPPSLLLWEPLYVVIKGVQIGIYSFEKIISNQIYVKKPILKVH